MMEVDVKEVHSMKVGFSFTKTSAVKKIETRESGEEDREADRDYITGISGNRLTSLVPSKRSGPLVIPLDTQGVIKRARIAPKEISTLDFKKEPVTPANKHNGGTLKLKSLDEQAAEALIAEAKNERAIEESDTVILPIMLQNQIEGIEHILDEDERFKYDVDSRPDEADEEAYEQVPIEEFGKAMLRGMGWETGKPIGLNNRGLTEPIEYVARQGRLGLGATPEIVEFKKKKFIKPGESREPKPIMVAPTGPDGKVRHVKRISEKLVPLNRGIVGKLAAIASGTHEGLYARVIQELPNDEVAVRLLASEEDVVVAKSDLNLTILESTLSETHPAMKYIAKEKSVHRNSDHKVGESSKSTPKSKSTSNGADSPYSSTHPPSSHTSSSHTASSHSSSSRTSSTWLYPHILVRVISKKFEGGKYYNKKGHIVDVVGRHECVVQLLDGTIVDRLSQSTLETVVPKPGGKVMVLNGSHKGALGTVLERKQHRDKEAAIVQLCGDLSLGTYELDDIAEFVGAPDSGAYMDM